MQFRVLGSLEVSANGAAAQLGSPKQRAVLAILLMHVGEIVSIDRLIDLLWGDRPPRTAAHSVQIYVSDLRKSLEPLAGRRLIATRPPGYQLETDVDTIDALRFERLVGDGIAAIEAGDRDHGAGALRSALGLWRGPALSDFVYEEFAQPYIHRLNDLHLGAIESLAAAELASGRTAEAIPLLDAAIREDPLRERSRELLMLALYRSGRHAEALRTYQRLRTLLDEELGLEPSPSIQRLQERILLHDPSLPLAPDGPAEVGDARNPYKGLRPFGEEDAADFFGRDALVERIIGAIGGGARLVALVGPSGSGKSSVLAAGVVPSLKGGSIRGSDRWLFATVVPGAHPLEEVETAVSKSAGLPVGLGHLLDEADPTTSPRSVLRTMPTDGRLVLIIDQFEELFTVTDEHVRRRFLQALTAAVSEPDGQVVVLLSLRADFYDRPLMHPAFAEVFIPSVTNVLPMTAHELEVAVVHPSEQVGVAVEPALLAELVAGTADQSGALPLLQFALTELFEQRTGSVLMLAGYHALGGLKGILSRRAESLYAALSVDEQRVAMQLFLRLVRSGHGTIDSRRRLQLSELTDLDLDPVVLSQVLGAFGRHRLLSFDRDPVSGAAIVEVAHEALLREWDRLAAWIDRHRAVLRRHETFAAAVEEWEHSGRDPDYVLTGSRLAEFEAWRQEGTLRLTGTEREFLDAGLERRSAEQSLESTRIETARRLERRSRLRLVGLAIAIVFSVAALGYGVWAGGNQTPRVALLHGGPSEVDALAEDGFDRAVSAFNLVGKDRIYDGANVADDLRGLSADGMGLIVVTDAMLDSEDWQQVIRDYPNTRYTIPSKYEAPNVSYLVYSNEEGSFLAGAAAALTTKTQTIGFVGGLDDWFIWSFQAGYEAGARAVSPEIKVLSTYLAEVGDFDGAFENPLGARQAAREMYAEGADIVFHAAGRSGIGVFEAAAELSTSGRHLWAIGVDTDQFATIERLPGLVDPAPWRGHILTSMLKHVDKGIYTVVEEYARGEFRPGLRQFGLSADAVNLSYSGGFIDAIRPRIDAFKASIVAGDIDVPCVPVDKRDEALERGLVELDCLD